MKRIIAEQRLGFVATADPNGTPNVSPKRTFVVLDDRTIAFSEVRSPGTMRNLRASSRIEVNFVDPFVRKSYRSAGRATLVERGDRAFDPLLSRLQSNLESRIRAIITIEVTKALPLSSPAYGDGQTETELRRAWTVRFRKNQPNEQFREQRLEAPQCGIERSQFEPWRSAFRAACRYGATQQRPRAILREPLNNPRIMAHCRN
jgi:predicted pyridoxine 5'-phosphate oxidase superfamily flavin-nucleotide-binding protein